MAVGPARFGAVMPAAERPSPAQPAGQIDCHCCRHTLAPFPLIACLGASLPRSAPPLPVAYSGLRPFSRWLPPLASSSDRRPRCRFALARPPRGIQGRRIRPGTSPPPLRCDTAAAAPQSSSSGTMGSRRF
ncbi:unnamed protein product [Urochloa humidicola]